MRDLRTFVLASLCVMTACSSSDESHVHLDFQPIRNSARAVGQRVDAGVVLMSTAETTITSNVDIDTWQFAIDLNVGDEVRFEAATCLGASGTCVTNYWGAASAILELTETPVVVNVYPAGELVLNLKRFDGLPVPAGVELELSGANPEAGLRHSRHAPVRRTNCQSILIRRACRWMMVSRLESTPVPPLSP